MTLFWFFYFFFAFVLLFALPGISIVMVLLASIYVVGATFLKAMFQGSKQQIPIPATVQDAAPLPPPSYDNAKDAAAQYADVVQMDEEHKDEELLHHQSDMHQIHEKELVQTEADQRSWQDRLEDGYRP